MRAATSRVGGQGQLNETKLAERPVRGATVTTATSNGATSNGAPSIGEALKGQRFGSFWKYRVGDWRIIASIEDDLVRILVLRIGNRREIYR